MLIKPITVRLIAYGSKANVAAIRTRAAALLKEEHNSVDEACFATLSAADVHAEISAKRLEAEVVLVKPTPSQAGVAITLPEVHERITTEWLFELPVAKSCVALALWKSEREPVAWQLLMANGDHWSENRPL
jgi:hypothetical protein